MADRDSAASGGAAQRRRARRLRQFIRHEKLSVAMHLAAALHHFYGRSGADASTQTETYAAPAPVVEYITPAPADRSTRAPVTEYVAPVMTDFLENPVPLIQ